MKPKFNITNEYIEIIGHYSDKILCAKLTLLCQLYGADVSNGYAKLEYNEDFLKDLNLIDGKLLFSSSPKVDVYLDGSLVESVNTQYTYIFRLSYSGTTAKFMAFNTASKRETIWQDTLAVSSLYIDGREAEAGTVLEVANGIDAECTNYVVYNSRGDIYSAYIYTYNPAQTGFNIFVGGNQVTSMFVGNSSVSKAFLGSTEL